MSNISKLACLLLSFFLTFLAYGQKKDKQISFALTNSHTAYPFASFSKLFSGPYHPGIELGYGFNWTNKKKHDWYQAFRLGYFYHRLAAMNPHTPEVAVGLLKTHPQPRTLGQGFVLVQKWCWQVVS